MKIFVLLGRFFYSIIFIVASIGHFSEPTMALAAAHGVPRPEILVPLSGVFILLGGLSVLLGYKTRFGATLIALFLIPATFMIHNFWTVTDPMAQAIQQIMFFKNLAMLGGAFLLIYYGAGPCSIDNKQAA